MRKVFIISLLFLGCKTVQPIVQPAQTPTLVKDSSGYIVVHFDTTDYRRMALHDITVRASKYHYFQYSCNDCSYDFIKDTVFVILYTK